jgi:hypothetical protein
MMAKLQGCFEEVGEACVGFKQRQDVESQRVLMNHSSTKAP